MTQNSDANDANARLADRIADGDSAAEQELVLKYGSRVYAIAVSRTGDSDVAQDVTQDVLLAVLEALRAGRLEDANKLSGFILGTTRNLINNFFRRSRPESDDSSSLPAATSSWPDWQLEAQQRRARVRGALADLAIIDRQILGLTLSRGLKPGEIAARLGLKSDVVRQRKTRAIRKIRQVLAESSQMDEPDHHLEGGTDR